MKMIPILTKERQIDDRVLVRKAQAGSREAFGQLVSRHHRAVRGFLGRYLGNPDDVDEVAQEVFMSALDGVVRFERKSTFKTWLMSIARNKAISRLRDSKNRPVQTMDRIELLVVDAQLQELLDENFDENFDKDRFDALAQCLDRLNDDHRKLVQKIYFDGARAADVARETGQARNTVRMRLMRIRKALLSCINKRAV